MKTISVAQLRQNPTEALAEVERGETYVVTRHRHEIGRLVPPAVRRGVAPDQFAAILRQTPLSQPWVEELAESRADFDRKPDPWQ